MKWTSDPSPEPAGWTNRGDVTFEEAAKLHVQSKPLPRIMDEWQAVNVYDDETCTEYTRQVFTIHVRCTECFDFRLRGPGSNDE